MNANSIEKASYLFRRQRKHTRNRIHNTKNITCQSNAHQIKQSNSDTIHKCQTRMSDQYHPQVTKRMPLLRFLAYYSFGVCIIHIPKFWKNLLP